VRALEHDRAARELAGAAVAKGVREVFLVGCGGSLCSAQVAQVVLEQRAAELSVFQLTSHEFTLRRPARLGERSLVVLGSHSGTTPETVEAGRLARAAGVRAIAAITRDEATPLAELADVAFTYGSEETVWAAQQILNLQIAYALLEETGASLDYDGIRAALGAMPEALVAAVTAQDGASHGVAARLQHEPITYVLGAGPNYGAAYGLAMCYLQEMQWMHAASFNAAEFLHGAFEIITSEVPVLVMLGEDDTRPIAERALAFVQRYSEKAVALDTRGVALPGVPDGHRDVVSPIVMMAWVSRLAAHYEDVRGHSLDLRRYMTKVAY
jgi:fructoselysine 6-phosphate deglycase